MMASGTSPLLPVDVLGDGLDLLLGEGAEGVLHQLEVGVEVTRTGDGGQGGEERRVAVGGQEGVGGLERVAVRSPTAASRPVSRVVRSCTASATKAQVSRASSSPLAP